MRRPIRLDTLGGTNEGDSLVGWSPQSEGTSPFTEGFEFGAMPHHGSEENPVFHPICETQLTCGCSPFDLAALH